MKHFYSFCLTVLTIFSLGLTSQSFAQGNTCATAIPLNVEINDCVNTEVSNVGLTNSGVIPAGAGCVGFNGGDLWLSVVIPPSGEVTVTTSFIPGTSNLNADFNMAGWTGDCGTLTHVGCDEDGGSGFYPAITLNGTPGETQYVQLWETANNTQTNFNVCANGTPTCTSPSVTYTRDCEGNNQWSINVNIANLGDAPELSIINDGGAPAITGITSPGSYNIGPFQLGQEVEYTVVHEGNADCNVSKTLTDVGKACENIITCGNDLNQIYCYGNVDNTEFKYSTSDGSPITLTFNSGLIQDPEDEIFMYDGTSTSDPQIYNGNNDGDLTGLTRTGASGHILLTISSDGGGSCQEGSLGLGGGWNWDVSCAAPTECNDAAQVISQTTFAASEVNADLNGVIFSGANECNGPGNNPDLYFKFTAVNTVSDIRATGSGDFDPAIEVYDACGGNQLACANSTGAGADEMTTVLGLNVGSEYVYRVYHAGATAATTTGFETGVRHNDIPSVQLRSDFCGITDYTPNDIVRSTTANPNTNINRYIWEFTELEPPFDVHVVNSPNGSNPQFRMFWFADFEYGRTYEVRTKVRMDGGAEGEYGAACTIGFAVEPVSALQPQYADGFYELCDIIKAVKINGATNYRWTFDDGSNVLEYNSNSGNYFCPLQNVNGLQLGESYDVNVYVTGGGVESTSSIQRVVNMNGFVANTSLNPAFVACGSTVALTQYTQAFNVCAASNFVFRFTNVSQPGEPVIEKVRPNRVIVFSQVPGLIEGDTYSVGVKAQAGGLVGDYSSECEITIAAPSGLLSETLEIQPQNSDAETSTLETDLSISPNPVANGGDVLITISSLEASQQSVQVQVFSLSGKMVYSNQFANSGEEFNARIQLDSALPMGIYLVRTTVNGEIHNHEKLIIE